MTGDVEKSVKAIANVKVSLSDDNPVNQVSFCPWDPTLAVAVGKGIVRLFRIIEGAFKSTTVAIRRENANVISHIWLPDDVLLLGTEAGEILLLENNPIYCLDQTLKSHLLSLIELNYICYQIHN